MFNVQQITSRLADMSDQQLQQYAQMHKDDPYILPLAASEFKRRQQTRMAIQGQQAQQQGQSPSVADQSLAQMQQAAPQQPALPEQQGIGLLPAQNIATMADGGIVGYEEGGRVRKKNENHRTLYPELYDASKQPDIPAELAKRLRVAQEAWRRKHKGTELPVTSGLRTREEQQRLYNDWKKGKANIHMPANPADWPGRQWFHADAVDISERVPESFLRTYGLHRPYGTNDPVHYTVHPHWDAPKEAAKLYEELKLPLTDRKAAPKAGTYTPPTSTQFQGVQVPRINPQGVTIPPAPAPAPVKKRDVDSEVAAAQKAAVEKMRAIEEARLAAERQAAHEATLDQRQAAQGEAVGMGALTQVEQMAQAVAQQKAQEEAIARRQAEQAAAQEQMVAAQHQAVGTGAAEQIAQARAEAQARREAALQAQIQAQAEARLAAEQRAARARELSGMTAEERAQREAAKAVIGQGAVDKVAELEDVRVSAERAKAEQAAVRQAKEDAAIQARNAEDLSPIINRSAIPSSVTVTPIEPAPKAAVSSKTPKATKRSATVAAAPAPAATSIPYMPSTPAERAQEGPRKELNAERVKVLPGGSATTSKVSKTMPTQPNPMDTLTPDLRNRDVPGSADAIEYERLLQAQRPPESSWLEKRGRELMGAPGAAWAAITGGVSPLTGTLYAGGKTLMGQPTTAEQGAEAMTYSPTGKYERESYEQLLQALEDFKVPPYVPGVANLRPAAKKPGTVAKAAAATQAAETARAAAETAKAPRLEAPKPARPVNMEDLPGFRKLPGEVNYEPRFSMENKRVFELSPEAQEFGAEAVRRRKLREQAMDVRKAEDSAAALEREAARAGDEVNAAEVVDRINKEREAAFLRGDLSSRAAPMVFNASRGQLEPEAAFIPNAEGVPREGAYTPWEDNYPSEKDTVTSPFTKNAEEKPDVGTTDGKEKKGGFGFTNDDLLMLGLQMMASPGGQSGNALQQLASNLGRSGIATLAARSEREKEARAAQKEKAQEAYMKAMTKQLGQPPEAVRMLESLRERPELWKKYQEMEWIKDLPSFRSSIINAYNKLLETMGDQAPSFEQYIAPVKELFYPNPPVNASVTPLQTQ